MERPILNNQLDSKTFRDYYYLKEELVDFCRKYGLPISGGKLEITERIAYYLDTGRILLTPVSKRKVISVTKISTDTVIEANFVCTQKYRDFFKTHIGTNFSFNVAFQKWLKINAGRTYTDAIEAYYQILDEKKKGKTKIDKQFEYNTYIRDYFEDNPGKSLNEAIKCWKYKKNLPGHNRYEESDLVRDGFADR